MELTWVREESPRWDAHKSAVFGVEGPHVFGLGASAGGPAEGQVLADEWWRVLDGDVTVGYGRLDSVWGDAEILVAVAPDRRGTGVAHFALRHLEREAGRRGLNYLYNTVPADHPDREHVLAWLRRQGFTDRGTGELRKRVDAAAA